jgi:hypothetical protein
MKMIATAAATALALGVTAVALAGEPSTDGQSHLILQVKASPPQAGTAKKPRAVGLEFSSREYTDDGQRGARDAKTIAFRFNGFRFHPEAFAKCKESELEKTGPSACPAASKLGSGDALADARPALPTPIAATAQAFNGVDDIDAAGKPITPVPAILVYAETSTGIKAYLPTLFQGKDGLITAEGTPPSPGERTPFTIAAVHLKLPVKTAKVKGKKVSYITAPTSCHGSWQYSQTNVYYSGADVQAFDSQPCVKAK